MTTCSVSGLCCRYHLWPIPFVVDSLCCRYPLKSIPFVAIPFVVMPFKLDTLWSPFVSIPLTWVWVLKDLLQRVQLSLAHSRRCFSYPTMSSKCTLQEEQSRATANDELSKDPLPPSRLARSGSFRRDFGFGDNLSLFVLLFLFGIISSASLLKIKLPLTLARRHLKYAQHFKKISTYLWIVRDRFSSFSISTSSIYIGSKSCRESRLEISGIVS